MKKILYTVITILCAHFVQAQIFIEGGLGYDFVDISGIRGTWVGTKRLNFQIGKFKNERLMRSFTISYKFGGKYAEDVDEQIFDPTTGNWAYYKYRPDLRRSSFYIGYERKRTIWDTEFDDLWQYYNILNYQLVLGSITDKTNYSKLNIPPTKSLNRPDFDITLDFGLGMARKFALKSYGFAEFRISSSGLAAMEIYTKFGVRHFIR